MSSVTRKTLASLTGIAWLAILSGSLPAPGRADETCMSPYMAKIVGQEDFIYVWTLGMEGVGDEQDKLVTVAWQIIRRAQELDQLSAANAALITLARLTGQLQDSRSKPDDAPGTLRDAAMAYSFEKVMEMRETLLEMQRRALPEPSVVVGVPVVETTDDPGPDGNVVKEG